MFKRWCFTAIVLISLYSLSGWTQTSTDIDESFDPFSDYNEFEQKTEEEADIDFLRNGRFLTVAFVGGYRGFLGGGFTQAYKGSINYGMQFNYFFDMQIAGAVGYTISDHSVAFNSFTNDSMNQVSQHYTGTVNIQVIDFHLKYYFNTDNVTKGLADLNPYGLLGGGYFIRTYSLSSSITADSDRVFGFKAGGGFEIPILKRQAYLGFQGTYNYVQFPDENKGFIDEGGGSSNTKPISPSLDGDIFEVNVLVGINF